MHARGMCAFTPHERTSLEAPSWSAETLVAAAEAVAARPRSRAVEPRPLVANEATIERPVRAAEGNSQRVVAGRLRGRVAEFELSRTTP